MLTLEPKNRLANGGEVFQRLKGIPEAPAALRLESGAAGSRASSSALPMLPRPPAQRTEMEGVRTSVVPAGASCDAVAGNLDVLPTFVKLAGGEVPKDRKIDGKDIGPLLFGKSKVSPHESYFYFNRNVLEAVRLAGGDFCTAGRPDASHDAGRDAHRGGQGGRRPDRLGLGSRARRRREPGADPDRLEDRRRRRDRAGDRLFRAPPARYAW